MNDVLSAEEVAQLLDCAVTTVEEMARRKELPATKPGRSWVFPREALLKALNDMALEHWRPAVPGHKPAVTVPTPQPTRPRRAVPPRLPTLENA